MLVSYVGLIKKNTNESKVLVLSPANRFYVWTASHDCIETLRISTIAGVPNDVPNDELELATERQVDIGRGNLWVPDSSHVMVDVRFCGIVSGGQLNKRVLVKFNNCLQTVVVPFDVAETAKDGDILKVDSRGLSIARDDQIDAGLGLGTLQRTKRVMKEFEYGRSKDI